MLTCKQASKLVSQSLDRPLSWSEKMQLTLHLFICNPCTRFKQQLKLLVVALRLGRTMTENDQDIKLPLDVKNRILQANESNSLQKPI